MPTAQSWLSDTRHAHSPPAVKEKSLLESLKRFHSVSSQARRLRIVGRSSSFNFSALSRLSTPAPANTAEAIAIGSQAASHLPRTLFHFRALGRANWYTSETRH